MRTNKFLTLSITLLLLTPHNITQAAEIKGEISCQYWFSGRSTLDMRLLNTTWLVGYLSANGWKSRDIYLNQTEIQSIELWTDEYCRNHPESSISIGARDLAKELQQKNNPLKSH